ncbi:MAG: hypothetical protein Q7K65_02965 [Candidatus Buchananbacteria bacterium]|nr:hypothetical protein [Candidatus Buchananbacteria bacterium]
MIKNKEELLEAARLLSLFKSLVASKEIFIFSETMSKLYFSQIGYLVFKNLHIMIGFDSNHVSIEAPTFNSLKEFEELASGYING